MNRQFLKERIEVTKALIIAHEEAAAALASGRVHSYTLDTGQSRQTVTKFDLSTINRTLDSLYNRLATLEARLNGSGVGHMAPGW